MKLVAAVVLALLAGQEAGPVKFAAEWQGGRSRIIAAQSLLVEARADWEWLWRRHAGPRAKAPEVDFERHRVAAVFWGARERDQAERIAGAELDRGMLFLKVVPDPELVPPGMKSGFPYSIVVIPKGPPTVLLSRPGASIELAPGRRPEGDVEETWAGSLKEPRKTEVLRITDAGGWGKAWKRAHPDLDPPEVDFETQMVLAVFLSETWNSLSAAPFGRGPGRVSVLLTDHSGPAVSRQLPGYVFLLTAGTDAALVVELRRSSFDHVKTVVTDPVKIGELPAIAKYGK